MEIRLDRPIPEEKKEIRGIFTKAIEQVFMDNGIEDAEDLKREIVGQMAALNSDFESKGSTNHYLIAKIDDVIVGTAAYGPVNGDILATIDLPNDSLEVKSVYVHPEYQGQGVGTLLYHSIVSQLAEKDIECFYLDCGYGTSQSFWEKELGEATHVVENKWGKGAHYKIWKVDLEESCLLKK